LKGSPPEVPQVYVSTVLFKMLPLPEKRPCRYCGRADRSANGLLKCQHPYLPLLKSLGLTSVHDSILRGGRGEAK
jgi:hypothetical protein